MKQKEAVSETTTTSTSARRHPQQQQHTQVNNDLDAMKLGIVHLFSQLDHHNTNNSNDETKQDVNDNNDKKEDYIRHHAWE